MFRGALGFNTMPATREEVWEGGGVKGVDAGGVDAADALHECCLYRSAICSIASYAACIFVAIYRLGRAVWRSTRLDDGRTVVLVHHSTATHGAKSACGCTV